MICNNIKSQNESKKSGYQLNLSTICLRIQPFQNVKPIIKNILIKSSNKYGTQTNNKLKGETVE